jgi:hypothetical protein
MAKSRSWTGQRDGCILAAPSVLLRPGQANLSAPRVPETSLRRLQTRDYFSCHLRKRGLGLTKGWPILSFFLEGTAHRHLQRIDGRRLRQHRRLRGQPIAGAYPRCWAPPDQVRSASPTGNPGPRVGILTARTRLVGDTAARDVCQTSHLGDILREQGAGRVLPPWTGAANRLGQPSQPFIVFRRESR